MPRRRAEGQRGRLLPLPNPEKLKTWILRLRTNHDPKYNGSFGTCPPPLRRDRPATPLHDNTFHSSCCIYLRGGTDLERGMGMCGPEDPLFTPLLPLARVPFQEKEAVHKTPF